MTATQLSDQDLFLVLASDGLWDVLMDADAVGLVMDTVKHPDLAAKRLVMEALSRGAFSQCWVGGRRGAVCGAQRC